MPITKKDRFFNDLKNINNLPMRVKIISSIIILFSIIAIILGLVFMNAWNINYTDAKGVKKSVGFLEWHNMSEIIFTKINRSPKTLNIVATVIYALTAVSILQFIFIIVYIVFFAQSQLSIRKYFYFLWVPTGIFTTALLATIISLGIYTHTIELLILSIVK